MTAQTVEQLHKLGACKEGRESTRPYATLGEWWNETDNLDWMLWLTEKLGLIDTKPMHLWRIWCARQAQHLMTDPRSITALDVAERHAGGLAPGEELSAAASAATLNAAWAAARKSQRTQLRLTFPASQINRMWANLMLEAQNDQT